MKKKFVFKVILTIFFSISISNNYIQAAKNSSLAILSAQETADHLWQLSFDSLWRLLNNESNDTFFQCQISQDNWHQIITQLMQSRAEYFFPHFFLVNDFLDLQKIFGCHANYQIPGIILDRNENYTLTLQERTKITLLDAHGNQIWQQDHDPLRSKGHRILDHCIPSSAIKMPTGIFSPCGNYILTTFQNSAFLWNIHGNLIRKFNYADEVWTAIFSHNGDKILIAPIHGDIEIWQFNQGSGQACDNTLTTIPNLSLIWDVKFSPDDANIVAMVGNYICMYNLETGNPICSFQTNNGDNVVISNSNPNHMVVFGSTFHAPLLCYFSGETIDEVKSFTEHNQILTEIRPLVHFSKDGQKLLITYPNSRIIIVNLRSGQLLYELTTKGIWADRIPVIGFLRQLRYKYRSWEEMAICWNIWPYVRSARYMSYQLTAEEIIFILLAMKNPQELHQRIAPNTPGGYYNVVTQIYYDLDDGIKEFLRMYYNFELPCHTKQQ